MRRGTFRKYDYETALARLKAKRQDKKPVSRFGLSQKPLKRSNGRLKARVARKGKTVDGDSRLAIKDECDQLVRKIVALRDHKCATCWAHNGLCVGHLFRRGIESLRWDLLNCAAQCYPCNSVHEEEPEHYIAAFITKHGADEYVKLCEQSRSKHKCTYLELIEIRDRLRAELQRIEAMKEARVA